MFARARRLLLVSGMVLTGLLAIIGSQACVAPAGASGSGVCFASSDGHVHRYDPATGSRIRLGMKAHSELHWSPNGRFAVGIDWKRTGTGDHQFLDVRVFDGLRGSEGVVRYKAGARFPHRLGYVRFGGWSADGSRFALEVFTQGTGNRGTSRLYVVTSGRRRVVASHAGGDAAALSPDGREVIYSQGKEMHKSLWMWDTRSGSTRRWLDASALSDDGFAFSVEPFWPSFASQLVLSVNHAGTIHSNHIALADLSSKAVTRVGAYGSVPCDVTPDGRFILLDSFTLGSMGIDQAVDLYDAQTGVLSRLLTPEEVRSYGQIESASLSPDGSQVAFAYEPQYASLSHAKSFVVLMSTGNPGVRTTIGKGWSPAWAPRSSTATRAGLVD